MTAASLTKSINPINNDMLQTTNNKSVARAACPFLRLICTAKKHGAVANLLLKHECVSSLYPASNRVIHNRNLAEEIWNATNGKVEVIIGQVDAGGTIAVVAQQIKKLKNNVQAITVEPLGLPAFFGGPNVFSRDYAGEKNLLNFLSSKFIDETFHLNEADFRPLSKEASRLDGIQLASFGGAIIWAALQVAKRSQSKGKTVVAFARFSPEPHSFRYSPSLN